jgi:hypothetical protein
MDPLRKLSLAMALGLVASVLATTPLAGELPVVTVYKSPTCGCCGKWVAHLREAGFEVKAIDTKDMGIIKSMAGIRPQLASCHTARVGNYVIEGHVPAEDIKRLLAEHPAVRGLSAPGMPQSSPGMDMGNASYQVMSFDAQDNTRVFAQH